MSLPRIIGDTLRTDTITFDSANPRPVLQTPKDSEETISVTIQARSTNAGTVWVGNSSAQVLELVAGNSVIIYISRLDNVYVRGVTGDVVSVVAMLAKGCLKEP